MHVNLKVINNCRFYGWTAKNNSNNRWAVIEFLYSEMYLSFGRANYTHKNERYEWVKPENMFVSLGSRRVRRDENAKIGHEIIDKNDSGKITSLLL